MTLKEAEDLLLSIDERFRLFTRASYIHKRQDDDYFIAQNETFFHPYDENENQKKTLVKTQDIVFAKDKLSKLGLDFNKERIEFFDKYILVANRGSYQKTYPIAEKIARILRCQYSMEDNPSLPNRVDEQVGIVYPSKKHDGFLLECANQSVLDQIKKFAKNLDIKIILGKDEAYFKSKDNVHYSPLWNKYETEEVWFNYHKGIAFYLNKQYSWNTTLEIKKVPECFIDIYKVAKFSPESLNYTVYNIKEIDNWMKDVEEFVNNWKDYNKSTRSSLNHSNYNNYSNYRRSSFYNDDIDMDQQSSEFWDDIS